MMKCLLTLLVAVLAAAEAPSGNDKLSLKTVVIDAGHGGKDPGAVSPDGKHYEKTFTLDIAKRLKEKIIAAYPDIKVILTRSDDSAVTLNRRAETANRASADLFISIHINASLDKTARGYSVHVLGKSKKENTDLFKMNLDMVKRENSVITLDDDFNPETAGFDPNNPESYIFMTMMQSAHLGNSIKLAQNMIDCLGAGPFSLSRGVCQDPFYVLWRTSMPAVLAELGFISNSKDLEILGSEDGRDRIAQALLDAFSLYKTEYDASMSIQSVQRADRVSEGEPQPSEQKTQAKEKRTVYGVQIFTVSKEVPQGDSRLLGYKPLIIKSGTRYRHIIGVSPDRSEALAVKEAVSGKYPDAFVVKLEVD
ncbi:MAG: N-acetylmuramoyl-L-alanine amidase [Candidatus Cryptobacteroides sp.]